MAASMQATAPQRYGTRTRVRLAVPAGRRWRGRGNAALAHWRQMWRTRWM